MEVPTVDDDASDAPKRVLRELQSESLHPTARVHDERRPLVRVPTQRAPRIYARENALEIRVGVSLRRDIADKSRVHGHRRRPGEFGAARLVRLRRSQKRRAQYRQRHQSRRREFGLPTI